MGYFRKVLIGILLINIFVLSYTQAEDNIHNDIVDVYEAFKKEIEAPLSSLKLIANIGNEDLNFNFTAGRNTYPLTFNKYIKNLPDGTSLTKNYLLRSLMEDNTITKAIKQNRIRDFVRNNQSFYVNELKSERKVIKNLLEKAFEEDLKGAIREFQFNKNNRIDAKWKKSLIGKIDELKVNIGSSSTANIDKFYDSLTDINDKARVLYLLCQ